MNLWFNNMKTNRYRFQQVMCLISGVPKQAFKIKENCYASYLSQQELKPFTSSIFNNNCNKATNYKIANTVHNNIANGTRNFHILTNNIKTQSICLLHCRSSSEGNNSKPEKTEQTILTRAQKLKRAIAEYGSTVIVFHVTISLISLGLFYLLVSSGLDVSNILISLGINVNGENANKIAANAGTFAIAYAIHKVFAPVRIAITLGATPFIVKYLRSIGFIKRK